MSEAHNKAVPYSPSPAPHPPSPILVALDARTVQDHFPGIGRYTYSLAEALAQLDVPLRLTLVYNPGLRNSMYDIAGLSAKYPDKIGLLRTAARPFSPGEQWQLFRPARRGDFAVWHAPYYIRPYILPVPSVLTVHDAIGRRIPDALPSVKARILLELTTRAALLASKKIIAVSQSAALDVQQLYGVKDAKITVAPHGVSNRFRPLDPDEITAARARLNLPEKYLLYVGINKPHKNHARLLEAFKVWRERTGDADRVLVLAGRADPRYTPQLTALADFLNLTPHVRFLHDVPDADLPDVYACAELFVFPSLQEGFGLPVLEAMKSGLPVVCANNSSLPEVAGDAALLFPAENVNAIAEAIEDGLGQKNQLRLKSLRRAALFSWQRTAEITYGVYESLGRR
jgi:glycosyltransferase involved in cell wall biosynthesis